MTSRDFCFWLMGFFELRKAEEKHAGIGPIQANMIKNHLALVFKHEIDPSLGGDAEELQAIHDAAVDAATDPNQPAPPWTKPPGPGGLLYRC